MTRTVVIVLIVAVVVVVVVVEKQKPRLTLQMTTTCSLVSFSESFQSYRMIPEGIPATMKLGAQPSDYLFTQHTKHDVSS